MIITWSKWEQLMLEAVQRPESDLMRDVRLSLQAHTQVILGLYLH